MRCRNCNGSGEGPNGTCKYCGGDGDNNNEKDEVMTIKVHEKLFLDAENYRSRIEIKKDGKSIFSVMDDEPEDSNMNRSFSDCNGVMELLKEFYELGKSGVAIEFTNEELVW